MTDLFDYRPPPVRHDHPETSHEAADKIAPVTGRWRKAIFEFASRDQGVTDDEIFARWPDESQSTLRPRRVELVQSRHLIDSGEKRPNRRGNPCIVWTINKEFNHG